MDGIVTKHTCECQNITGGGKGHRMDPTSTWTAVLSTKCIERKSFAPDSSGGSIMMGNLVPRVIKVAFSKLIYLLSTSLINAEKTRAFMSALPAANNTLFGCQSMARTVERMGFFICFDTHQLFSSSKLQIATVLFIVSPLNNFQENELPGTTGHRKFIFFGTPSDSGSPSVDSNSYQGRLPHVFSRFWIW